MWEIYETLIEAVPAESTVKACLAGLHWFAVRSEGTGLAMTPREGAACLPRAGEIAGMRTRDFAASVKSWNFHEAALGLAAINSALNSIASIGHSVGLCPGQQPDEGVFTYLLNEFHGKKVAVVGHFRNLERVQAVCDLSILERLPQPGDFPDPACEWILPEQDYVVITATTLINKTLPRLLELSRNARVVLAGPSTPLTPKLFEFGIDMLGGLVVEDEARVWTVIQEGGQHQIFRNGSRMVKFSRESAVCEVA
ncbi:MAG: Rossmann-like domain-containing protein [Bryobacteraceae bacterium]